MANDTSTPASYAEAINRAFNLVVATLLGITALAFGSDLLVEVDPIDKIDNSLLALLGVIAVVWYFTGRHWAKRSSFPLILVALALIVQIAGFVIEIGDPTALGDDIPGLTVYVPALIIAAALYSFNGRYLVAGGASSRTASGPSGPSGG